MEIIENGKHVSIKLTSDSTSGDMLLYCLMFFLLVMIIVSVIDIYSKNKETNRKNSFKKIYTSIENDVEYIFNTFFKYDLMGYVLTSKNLLGTDELKDKCNEIYKYFVAIYPKNEYKKYDKVLNGELDKLVIKSIYNKLIDFNNNVNLSIKQKDLKL